MVFALFIHRMDVKFFSKASSFLLLGVLVSIFSMILLPLSPSFVDFFLSLNLTGALLLLLVSFYIGDTLKIASLPTILLVSTLFRLALEIATSRLILTTGDAGHVIRTFGEFAVAGNFVVGVIVFLMVTFVQFVVIAKGSERVAEVAARFNLDALPGRQMSIDADLRAGVISADEAKQAREKLRRESRLFGAMDGAMKFVKGDAIAGIFITVINLLGGFAIGVLVRDLPLSQALQSYSLMTIGSGLVAQIPSLLISLAAGVALTRIASEDPSHLGQEITAELLKEPKALGTGAVLVGAMGFVPGFPGLIFWSLAILLGGISYGVARLQRLSRDAKMQIPPREITSASLPLVLELAPGLYQDLHHNPEWNGFLDKLLPQAIQWLANDIGINLPVPLLVSNSRLTPDQAYQIKIQALSVTSGILPLEPEPKKALLLTLAKTLRHHAYKFLTIQEVKNRLRHLEQGAPDLVQEVIPRLIQVQKLTEVLQRLAQEWISVKDLSRILHELTLLNPDNKDPILLSEQLRAALKDQITERFAGRGRILPAFLLDETIEDQVQEHIHHQGGEAYLTLPPEQMGPIVRAITGQVLRQTAVRGPILTRPEIRRFVHKMMESRYYHIPILSFNELEADVIIQPLGKITLPESGLPTIGGIYERQKVTGLPESGSPESGLAVV